MNIYLLENEDHPLPAGLDALLEKQGALFERVALPANHEDLIQVFGAKPGGLVVLPSWWEDLTVIKCVEELTNLGAPFTTLIAGVLPPVAVLALAFNEGLTAVLEVPDGAAPDVQRMRKVLARARVRHTQKAKASRTERQAAGPGREPAERGRRFELRVRDHYLGQAFLECAKRGGPLFDSTVKVLLVSSSESQQRQMEKVLSSVGVAIDEARSMKDALAAAETHEYVVIVLDNVLPDGDAINFAAELRKRPLDRMPRLVVWSASPERIPELLRPDTGIDDAILKPDPNAGMESVLPTIIAAVYQARE